VFGRIKTYYYLHYIEHNGDDCPKEWSSFIPKKNSIKLSLGTLITNLFS